MNFKFEITRHNANLFQKWREGGSREKKILKVNTSCRQQRSEKKINRKQ